MSEVKDYFIKPIKFKQAKEFCQEWHYTKTMPSGSYYFGLFKKKKLKTKKWITKLLGVAVYGPPAMKNQAKCYECDIELRRLCLINKTPKNAESRFIGLTLQEIKKEGYKAVLALADPEHNHTGIVYKASNFEFLGFQKGGPSRLLIIDGEIVHSRTAFDIYKTSGIKSLQKLLGEDRVQGKNLQRKYVYRYKLKPFPTKSKPSLDLHLK